MGYPISQVLEMAKFRFVGLLVTILVLQCNFNYGLLSEELGPSRILMLPMPGENHTHMSSFSHLADELVSLGHDVYLLVPQDYEELDKMKKGGVKPLLYGGSGGSRMYREYSTDYSRTPVGKEENFDISYDEYIRRLVPFYKGQCSAILGDSDLMQRLRRMNFDIAIVDAHPWSRCLYVLPYRLGIQYISMAKQVEPRLQGLPMMPAVNPFVFGSDFTDQMNLWQRVKNLYSFMCWNFDPKIEMLRRDYLSRFIPDKASMDADDLAKDSMLWLIETDPLLDYPNNPRLPFMINVGGMTTQKPKQMSNDLQRFMNEAKEGVILVDLGLHSDQMPFDLTEKMTSALKQSKFNVIWHLPGERPTRHNAKINFVNEYPRNDLLGHSNARLYISDGDHNGQYEAIYHGVPSIIFPMHGGQSYVANQVVYREYGQRLDAKHFYPNQLIDCIEEVTKNHSYTDNVQKASRIFKSRKFIPSERAAGWVEHVIKYGGDYMKPHGSHMSFWSFYMLDIFIYGFFGVLFGFMFVYRFVRWICRRVCCGRSRRNAYDDEYDDEDDDDMYESDSGIVRPAGYGRHEGKRYRGGYRHKQKKF